METPSEHSTERWEPSIGTHLCIRQSWRPSPSTVGSQSGSPAFTEPLPCPFKLVASRQLIIEPQKLLRLVYAESISMSICVWQTPCSFPHFLLHCFVSCSCGLVPCCVVFGVSLSDPLGIFSLKRQLSFLSVNFP